MAKAGRKRKDVPRTKSGLPSRAGQYKGTCERGVYIMTADGSGCIKIGISNGPARRSDGIQTSNPFPVRLYAFWSLGNEASRRLELECHKRLRQRHVHASGEWYRIAPDVAESFVKTVAAELAIDMASEAA